MKFKFETGKVIECYDESIAKILRTDKRYKELKEETPKGDGKKAETPKGDDSDGKVQK